jgi:hypothetical protein
METHMPSVEVVTKTTLAIDMKVAAEWFSALTDEQQADFFIEVARLSAEWGCRGHWGEQYYLVGRHLRDCECSTENAREMVRSLADGLTNRAEAA